MQSGLDRRSIFIDVSWISDESSDESSVESSNVKGSRDQKSQVIVTDDDDSPQGSEQKKDVFSDECQMPVLEKEIDCIVLLHLMMFVK